MMMTKAGKEKEDNLYIFHQHFASAALSQKLYQDKE
jgi:hypothetical protein